MAKDTSTTFQFSGRDTLPQFGVFFFVFGGGCLPIPFMVYDGFGLHAVVALFVVAFLAAIGLRFSITVSADGVKIIRSWFGIPYWFHKGRVIKDVFFGGDYGEAEGASGVVLVIDDREYHIGSGKSMHHLHTSLLPLASRDRERLRTDQFTNV